ncbi:MAG: hypothetical protein LBN38_05010 [Verrucomicrobiota bacterium]|nr:hypothetical protein [Verrucomicrobiota bacterium]
MERLDDFLRVSRKELLTHAGKISREVAERKALSEFVRYKERTADELSPVEPHFIASLEVEQKQLEDKAKRKK